MAAAGAARRDGCLAVGGQLIEMALQAIAALPPALIASAVFLQIVGAGTAQAMSAAACAFMDGFAVSGVLPVTGGKRHASKHQHQAENGFLHRRISNFALQPIYGGGRYWDRTSDPYDVNVVLSR